MIISNPARHNTLYSVNNVIMPRCNGRQRWPLIAGSSFVIMFVLLNESRTMTSVSAVRCPKYEVRYNALSRSAELGDCQGSLCRVDVCVDGKIHEGLYCGLGSCNVFGFDCDGGCFETGYTDEKVAVSAKERQSLVEDNFLSEHPNIKIKPKYKIIC